MAGTTTISTQQRPFFYTLFFLYLEPIITVAGTFMAHFRAAEYIRLTSHLPVITTTTIHTTAAAAAIVPPTTQIILSQLANMYLFVAIIESTVLRATNDLKVWRRVIWALLIADVGHVLSVFVDELSLQSYHKQEKIVGGGKGDGVYTIKYINGMKWIGEMWGLCILLRW